jgi:hypothetical protein
MAQQPTYNGGAEISRERQLLKRSLTLLPLFGIIYFTISGGTFGIESLFSYSGAGMALLLIGITPFVYSIPNILMVRELQSMMPVEGSYYHWTKQGLNPFMGFMTGWMNWVMSWVDVAIYPVLGATYLGFFVPQLSDGWGGVPGWVHQRVDRRHHLDSAAHHERARFLQLGRPRQYLCYVIPSKRHRDDGSLCGRALRGHVELHGVGTAYFRR